MPQDGFRESARQLLDRIATLVDDERRVAQEAISRLWGLPLEERIRLGRAIGGVRVEEVSSGGELTLSCPDNDSLFREGDMVRLSRGDPWGQEAVTGSLEIDDDTELVVRLEQLGDAERFRLEPEGWVVDEGYLDLHGMFDKALQEAADSRTGQQKILPLLQNLLLPQLDPDAYREALRRAEGLGLDDSQAEGFAQCFATDFYHAVQGPPGTGKTQVLAQLAAALVERGERVLVTAFTHRAINNVLEKIAALSPQTPLVKVGRSIRRPDGVENVERLSDWEGVREREAYVVGATPFACRGPRLGGVRFDTLIFDEASQMTLPLAVMAMLAGERYLFFGDHQQLPPVLQSRDFRGALHESIFAVLAERGHATLLETTYRLNDQLTEWPSAHFYDGRLSPSANAATRRLELLSPLPAQWAAILGPEPSRVWIEVPESDARTRSPAEERVIAELCGALVESGMPPEEIGVVAPFRAQGRAIRRRLRRRLPGEGRKIVADTVERMQGQEREVVIVSFTVGSRAAAEQLGEFLLQPQRLNVAVTRPRRKLILVASSALLELQPWGEYQEAAHRLCCDLFSRCARFPAPRLGSE